MFSNRTREGQQYLSFRINRTIVLRLRPISTVDFGGQAKGRGSVEGTGHWEWGILKDEPQHNVIRKATYWINPSCRGRQRGVCAKKRIKESRLSVDRDGEQAAWTRCEKEFFSFRLLGEKARDRIRGKMVAHSQKGTTPLTLASMQNHISQIDSRTFRMQSKLGP
jgi:hypothetical protein